MTDAMVSSVRLARALSALGRGLSYPGSEGDSPYEPFHVQADAAGPVGADVLRSALNVASWWQIELSDGEQWLTGVVAQSRDNGAFEDARAYELIRQTMQATLDGPLQCAGIAAPPQRSYHPTRRLVFGRFGDAALVGLLARSVET
jgi:hypothetical protein